MQQKIILKQNVHWILNCSTKTVNYTAYFNSYRSLIAIEKRTDKGTKIVMEMPKTAKFVGFSEFTSNPKMSDSRIYRMYNANYKGINKIRTDQGYYRTQIEILKDMWVTITNCEFYNH